jgi:hypothetical protein
MIGKPAHHPDRLANARPSAKAGISIPSSKTMISPPNTLHNFCSDFRKPDFRGVYANRRWAD